MATENDVRAALTYLGTAFRVEIDDAMVRTYTGALAQVTLDELRTACKWIVEHDEWFPKVARIHEVRRLNQAGTSSIAALPVVRWTKSESNRIAKYGQAMARAAAAGYATVWLKGSGAGEQVTHGSPAVALDWKNDVVALDDGRDMTVDEFLETLGEVEIGTGESRGHDHRAGARGCRVCSAPPRCVEPDIPDGESCPVCESRKTIGGITAVARRYCLTCNTAFNGGREEWEANRWLRRLAT